ncbi:MAG TPA: type II toxin-antitoxin system HicB family antitoxin [Halococcus sp.]|nr:type II toxin-antitoxin system HicB family antitoxin [Halococcus sp.]
MSVEASYDEEILIAHETETDLWVATERSSEIAGQGDNPIAAVKNLYDALDGHAGEGRPPTEEELRKADIDPKDNSDGGELPEVLK